MVPCTCGIHADASERKTDRRPPIAGTLQVAGDPNKAVEKDKKDQYSLAYLETTDIMRCKREARHRQAKTTAKRLRHSLKARLAVSTPVLEPKA